MNRVVYPPELKPIDPPHAMRDVAPHTIAEVGTEPKSARIGDVLQLFKLRVTAMVVLTAWAGYFVAARYTEASLFSVRLLATLVGVGLVSAAAAALNQVLERDADAKMARTKDRPLPAKRMTPQTAAIVGSAAGLAGLALLTFATNSVTAILAAATAATYVLVYTPLKKTGPISTFVGAFPGAMPAVLGWTAAGGSLRWEPLALFAIVFFWQFPHFLSIAWLYREDYEQAGIRMLPVIDPTGRATIRQILGYGVLLVPVSLVPFFLGMAGWTYLVGAIVLGIAYLFCGLRLALLRLPPTAAHSKKEARELLQASIAYLPLLFVLLMLNGVSR